MGQMRSSPGSPGVPFRGAGRPTSHTFILSAMMGLCKAAIITRPEQDLGKLPVRVEQGVGQWVQRSEGGGDQARLGEFRTLFWCRWRRFSPQIRGPPSGPQARFSGPSPAPGGSPPQLAPQTYPKFSRPPPRSGIWPHTGRVRADWSKSTQSRSIPDPGNIWPITAEFWLPSANVSPTSVDSSHVWPDSGDTGPSSVDLGPGVGECLLAPPASAPTSTNFEQCPAEARAKFGRCCPESAKSGRIRADFHPCGVELGQVRP